MRKHIIRREKETPPNTDNKGKLTCNTCLPSGNATSLYCRVVRNKVGLVPLIYEIDINPANNQNSIK